ncbi:MAG TPA: MMPL family transporter [Bdellovibrionota bacterium]|nr:MMPL family transporter [Bdellovibrionota bacterium]
MQKFWDALARFNEKYYIIIIFVTLGITGLCLLTTKKIKIDTNLASLLPREYKSVQNLDRVIEKLGGLGDFTLLIENESLEVRKEFVRELAKTVETHPSIRYVDYEYEKSYFQDHLLLYIDLEDIKTIRKRLKEKIKFEKRAANPFFVNIFNQRVDLDFSDLEDKYSRRFNVKKGFKREEQADGYFVNPGGKTIAVIVKPHGSESDIGSARKIYAYLKETTKKLNDEKYSGKLSIDIAGPFRYKVDEYDTVLFDIKTTSVFSTIGVILFLTLLFRQFIAVFFIALPLVMGIIWTFAILTPFLESLNLVTSFMFAVLFGLGVDYGIHMFARYLECRYRKQSVHDSLVVILSKTGRSCLMVALTTATAFFVMLLTDFKGFSEMGLIAGTGVILTLVSIYVIFPPLLVLCEKLKFIRMREMPHTAYMKAGFPHSKKILVVGTIIALASIVGFSQVELEYDFTNLRANLETTLPLREKIGTIFTRSQSPAVVIAEDYDEALAVINAVEKKIADDKESPTIDSVLSLPSIYPPDQGEKLEEIKKLKIQLEDKALKQVEDPVVKEHLEEFRDAAKITDKVELSKIPNNLLRQFKGVDGSPGHFVYIFPSVQLRDGREAIRFSDDIREIKGVVTRKIQKDGVTEIVQEEKVFYPSSDAIVFADMLHVMISDGRLAVLLCLITVFLFIFLDFRSLKMTLLVLIPLLCGVIFMCGLMFVFGLKLNFFNIIIIPTLIGIGIDSGIHIIHRYKDEGPQSLLLVLRQTGGAISVTAVTTMVGYGAMVIAYHPGLKSLGILSIIGIGTCFSFAVTFLPAMLQFLEDRNKI